MKKSNTFDAAIHGGSKDYSYLPKALLSQLGEVPDSLLARIYGVSQKTVSKARKRRGVKRLTKLAYWKKQILSNEPLREKLGKVPFEDLKTEYGYSVVQLKEAAKTIGAPTGGITPFRLLREDPKFVSMLGTCSDSEVGTLFGMNRRAVRLQRVKRGIPAALSKNYPNHRSYNDG